MRTGRNEPCPCGSGKKFKRCCLEGSQALCEPGDWVRARAALSEWVDEYLDTDADRAFDVFWAPVRGLDDELMFEPGLGNDGVFEDWYQFDRPVPWAGGRTAVDLFLASAGRSLSPGERRVVQLQKATTLRLYEVEERGPGGPLRLRDVMEGGRVSLRDDYRGLRFQRADWMASRVEASGDPEIMALSGAMVFGEAARDGVRARLVEERARFLEGHPGASVDAFYRTVPPLLHELWVRSVVAGTSPKLERWRPGEEARLG